MRVSPVGYAYDSLDEVLLRAKWTAEVTHDHPEAIKGAQATAAAVFLARTGSDKEQIRDYVERKFGYRLDVRIDDIRPGFDFDVSCQAPCRRPSWRSWSRPTTKTRCAWRSRWAATPTRWPASPAGSPRRITAAYRRDPRPGPPWLDDPLRAILDEFEA